MSHVKQGINDLATLRPEIAEEWDLEMNPGIRPDDVTCGSEKKIWWRCKEGHSWQAKVYSRTEGSGCPVCANDINRHTIIPGENDLASNYPDLVEEWDDERNADITPESIAAKSNRKVWWKCSNGHHWRATPLGRSMGAGCPVCAGKRPVISRLI